MKPIFKQEKEFLEKHLGIEIPEYSWRKGSKIYINHFDKKPYITFKVDLMNETIDLKKINDKTISLSYKEEYDLMKEDIEKREKDSLENTKKMLLHFKDTHKLFVSVSGGKDSELMKYIVDKSIKELGIDIPYNLIAFNTTNETAETYRFLKGHYRMTKENIISPKKGWYKWLKEDKNYFIPTIFVRNCCSTYKEGQLKKVMNKDELTCTFLGMRRQESNKRSHYSWDLNKSQLEAGKKLNVPTNWERMLPIVEWSDAEVWLYILHNNLEFNDMYKYGFHRVGCLICPYCNEYEDLLIRTYFPRHWQNWIKILEKNYEIKNVRKRLKWSFEEYSKGGKWKTGISKEQEIISKKATPERIKELAELKDINEDIAKEYFHKTCNECSKNLNPTEVALNLKIRGDNIEKYYCKKHLGNLLNLTGKELTEMTVNFMDQDCKLF